MITTGWSKKPRMQRVRPNRKRRQAENRASVWNVGRPGFRRNIACETALDAERVLDDPSGAIAVVDVNCLFEYASLILAPRDIAPRRPGWLARSRAFGPSPPTPPSLSAPIFLRLAHHGRRRWVLDLEPVVDPTRAIV